MSTPVSNLLLFANRIILKLYIKDFGDKQLSNTGKYKAFRVWKVGERRICVTQEVPMIHENFLLPILSDLLSVIKADVSMSS